MTREEEIKKKAKECGQRLFPDDHNIWARPNYEAQAVECACIEIAKWADEHPKKRLVSIDKACEWLRRNYTNYMIQDLSKYVEDVCSFDIFSDSLVEDFRKTMEE